MVHALHEIHWALADNGALIDLRPVLDRWVVEVTSGNSTQETGRVRDLPNGIEDDKAAHQSITQAARNGWFVQTQSEFFPFLYSWDSPREMEEYIESEWKDFIALDEETKQATRSAWALANADARVRIRVKMTLTNWRKQHV